MGPIVDLGKVSVVAHLIPGHIPLFVQKAILEMALSKNELSTLVTNSPSLIVMSLEVALLPPRRTPTLSL